MPGEDLTNKNPARHFRLLARPILDEGGDSSQRSLLESFLKENDRRRLVKKNVVPSKPPTTAELET